MQANENILSVSELNQKVKILLEDYFLNFWVQGEISGLTQSSLGHFYFTLKDDKAQISCALFKYQAKKLNFQLTEGSLVQLTGKITLYEPKGIYQIIVSQIEPQGLGKLYLEYLKLKEKLEQLGYFDSDRKKPIPFFPKKIGVITSISGAVIRDIITTLKRRMSPIGIILYPALVQGKGSELEVADAIKVANQRNEVDILIIARGGGSLEDLWSFNEQIVIDAIYNSHIPIISAIGHETDYTLADFVADLRAPTPTGAAELASPHYVNLLTHLNNYQKRLYDHLINRYNEVSQQLDWFNKMLVHPNYLLQHNQQLLANYHFLLKKGITGALNQYQLQLNQYQIILQEQKPNFGQIQQNIKQLSNLLEYHFELFLQAKKNAFKELFQQQKYFAPNLEKYQQLINSANIELENTINQFFKQQENNLVHRTLLIEALSPQRTLERGYSIVTDRAGNIIVSGRNLKRNQKLNIRFAKGHAKVIVNNQIDLFD